jgi:hypothetical protein
MHLRNIIGLTAILAGSGVGAMGLSSYQASSVARQQYFFVGWPKGVPAPIRFKSALYTQDGMSFVRIDEGNLFPKKDDTPVRTTADFDSLKVFSLTPLHSVPTAEGRAYVRDTLWSPAFVIGKLWVFPKVSGPVSLYTLQPRHGAYRGMDTGAGLTGYSEAAVRRKISGNPRAARLLRQQKIGHTVAWGMGIGGLGLVAVGAVTTVVSEDGPGSPIMWAGLGIAAFAWIPHLMVEDRYEAAVKAYYEDAAAK